MLFDRRTTKIERLLRAGRPEPRSEFVRRLTVQADSRRRTVRPALRAALVTGTMIIGLAAVGSFGFAMTLTGGFVTKAVVRVSHVVLHVGTKKKVTHKIIT